MCTKNIKNWQELVEFVAFQRKTIASKINFVLGHKAKRKAILPTLDGLLSRRQVNGPHVEFTSKNHFGKST